jgi:hypothetical protein
MAKQSLILPEAQASQPDRYIHDGAHNQLWRTSSAWGSEGALGFSGASQSPLVSCRYRGQIPHQIAGDS